MTSILLALLLCGTARTEVPSEVSTEFRVSALSKTAYDSKANFIECADWNDEFVLCPLIVDEHRLQFTNMTNVSSELMVTHMRQSSRVAVSKERFSWITIEDKDQGYWATGNRDGWDAAGWLHPSTLEKIAGGPILAAQPTSDMFCFWPKLSTEIHKNMAVGIKQAYEQGVNKVSSKIYQWDGEQWRVWGEAQPASKKAPNPPKKSLQ